MTNSECITRQFIHSKNRNCEHRDDEDDNYDDVIDWMCQCHNDAINRTSDSKNGTQRNEEQKKQKKTVLIANKTIRMKMSFFLYAPLYRRSFHFFCLFLSRASMINYSKIIVYKLLISLWQWHLVITQRKRTKERIEKKEKTKREIFAIAFHTHFDWRFLFFIFIRFRFPSHCRFCLSFTLCFYSFSLSISSLLRVSNRLAVCCYSDLYMCVCATVVYYSSASFIAIVWLSVHQHRAK